MGMYDDIVTGVSENIEIMGYPFFAENITGDEPFNRREYNRNSILSGTEHVTRGKYISRSYSFTTTIYHPTGRPDAHDKILKEIISKPVTIISPYMGGTFKAEVTFQRSFEEASPNHYKLDVTVNEIPGSKSNIPGENFIVPSPKKIKVKNSKKVISKNKLNSKKKRS